MAQYQVAAPIGTVPEKNKYAQIATKKSMQLRRVALSGAIGNPDKPQSGGEHPVIKAP